MGSSINSVRNTHTPVPGGFLRQASFRAFVGTLLFLLPVLAAVAEWPTYRHDNARSGQTPESLLPKELGPAWHWKSLRPPLPAWAGPAKWDAYNDIPRLNSMRNYDAALHTTVGGGKVYFGSSIDDTVHCLDAATGAPLWSYTTDGPVRIAPSLAEGSVYFGSDDGSAYCLDAETGALEWKFNPRADYRKVINNNRLISFWPVRTGVTVEEGTAYFCCSMLPWRRSYLCAVDAKTGKVEGEGRYVKELSDSHSFEGAMLASKELLIVPQGRIAPLILNRKDGTRRGKVDYHGSGCFALLTPDNQLFHGPGNRDGNFTASNPNTGARLATFPMGQSLIVAGETAYLLSTPTKNAINPKKQEDLNIALNADKEPLITTHFDRQKLGRPVITAFDRATKKIRFRATGLSVVSMILAGDTIYAGLVDGVAALSADDGSVLWEASVHGRAFGLAVAAGGLFVSTDEGQITCFRAEGNEKSHSLRQKFAPLQIDSENASPAKLAWGPLLQFDTPTSATVRWGTGEKMPTRLEYLSASGKQSVTDATLKQEHQVPLKNLGHRRNHPYAILQTDATGQKQRSTFDCDTFFNYSTWPANETSAGEAEQAAGEAAKKIIAQGGTGPGLCVVLGAGPLAGAIAAQSDWTVLCLETDQEKIASTRTQLLRAGLYGHRVAVLPVESFEAVPLPSHFANLVVSAATSAGQDPEIGATEAFRLLRPEEGLGVFGQVATENAEAAVERLEDYFHRDAIPATFIADKDGVWARFVKPTLEGAGEWSHQYGRADNSAFGGELLGYTSVANEMETQWVGRPGPRYQPDRSGRKPGPLSTGGRLFAQGLERIVAVDTYNGTILWSAEVPGMRRFNIPRDSSNWCADEEAVYAAVGDRCWQFNARDGQLRMQYTLPEEASARTKGPTDRQWSYVGSLGPLLLGSATAADAPYEEFRGHAAWYDQPKGPQAAKVCSDSLFALAKQTGALLWNYRDGLILNPTITATPERIYFVVCRHPELLAADSRRIDSPDLWENQFLVALDVNTGERLWEQPLDTDDGESVFYLAHQREKLVIVSSGSGKYHVSVYDDQDGKLAWEDRFDWPGGAHDHGKAMSRPAMINGNLFVRPRVFDLASGQTLAKVMPGGGCGTYACAGNFLIFRSGNITLWDHRYEIPSQWARLRPGCWLSAIPANGMLLAPEAGGGCSCGTWMETSVGFMPKKAKPVKLQAAN
ncbi:MAG: PQQ-binding-like beta-propeller repeat protein [Pirellulales bacterium]|nr:PQQ-binding-like beta-propeller repeat protein [Pirellulales bacterium]